MPLLVYHPKSTHTELFPEFVHLIEYLRTSVPQQFHQLSPYPDFLFFYFFPLKSKQIALSVSCLVVSPSSLNPWPQVTFLSWLTHLPQVGLPKHFPNKGNSNSLRGILLPVVKRIECSSSSPPNNKVTKVEGDLFSFKK